MAPLRENEPGRKGDPGLLRLKAGVAGCHCIRTKAGKLTVYPKLTFLKHWRDMFFWVQVPADFPFHRQWTKPCLQMEHIPDRGLTRREKEAFDSSRPHPYWPPKALREYRYRSFGYPMLVMSLVTPPSLHQIFAVLNLMVGPYCYF